MALLKFFILLGLMLEVQCDSYTLRRRSGDIENFSGGYSTYKLRMEKNSRIFIAVNQLRLGEGGYLELKDGRYGTVKIYTMKGSKIFDESGISVTLPINMETESWKLFIKVNGSFGDGFSAHYASYSGSGCSKDNIYNVSGEISCDTDELIPVANACNVTLTCEKNYVQYRKRRNCGTEGEWEGDIQCQPDRERLLECTFDLHTPTELEQNEHQTIHNGRDGQCPFSSLEMTNFYIDMENVHPFEPELGRTIGDRQIKCTRICEHNGAVFRFRCPTRFNRWTKRVFVRCHICRVLYGCKQNYAVL